MTKNKYLFILMLSISLSCLTAGKGMAEDYIKNIEIGDSSIKMDQKEFPPAACLYIELKNNGDKKISNVTFAINYFDTEGYSLKKVVVKNALTEAIPKRETRKYKIRLKGDVVNIEREQYPYSMQGKVGEFDIKIISAKVVSK